MISASFLEESPTRNLIYIGKGFLKLILVWFGLRSSEIGQFWGWMRTRGEYRAIMRAAGLVSITDNFVITPHQRTYFIQNRINGAE